MNRAIVTSVALIVATSVVRRWYANQPITRVMIGAYVLLLVLSLADLYQPLSNLAGAIALIAALYVVMNYFPWDILSKIVGSTPAPNYQSCPCPGGGTGILVNGQCVCR